MASHHDQRPPRWTAEDVAAAARLAPSWQADSERVFAVAVHEPGVYQATALLVGALSRRLRELGTGPAVLVAAWSERRGHLDAVLVESGLGPGAPGLDLEATAGAAFALRYREVVEEIAAARRLERMASAEPVHGWLVLEESGARDADDVSGYRRVELEPSRGRAVLVTTRPDETLTGCVHEILPVRVDPSSGAIGWDGDAEVTSYPDAASREAAVAAMKQ